jgi:hypothetical protein
MTESLFHLTPPYRPTRRYALGSGWRCVETTNTTIVVESWKFNPVFVALGSSARDRLSYVVTFTLSPVGGVTPIRCEGRIQIVYGANGDRATLGTAVDLDVVEMFKAIFEERPE